MGMSTASINPHCFTAYVTLQYQKQAFDLVLKCCNPKIKRQVGFYECSGIFLHTWTVLMILSHVIKHILYLKHETGVSEHAIQLERQLQKEYYLVFTYKHTCTHKEVLRHLP